MVSSAGLNPSAPPAETMTTLENISAQITALSSPVKQVVRGVITGTQYLYTKTATLPAEVDPNKCVVLLGDVVVSVVSEYPRTGTVLVSLEPTSITVQRDPYIGFNWFVSYQIIEYK